MFCGQPDWKQFFAMPRPSLSIEEENFLNNQVEQLCAMVDEWEMTFKNHYFRAPNEQPAITNHRTAYARRA